MKARRYLVEGRVLVQVAGRFGVLARVRGSGARHLVTFTSDGWSCSCSALGRCSHLLAVGLVTAPTPIRQDVTP